MNVGDLVAYQQTVWYARGIGIVIYRDEKRNVLHVAAADPKLRGKPVITFERSLEVLSENR
jgi:hypothetical protein